MLSSEDTIVERLQKAVREKDADTLQELLPFAPEYDRHLAQNYRTYEAARLCGYEVEMRIDDYGWLKTENLEEKCERIRHEGKGFSIEILILQHPNGKWVTGHNISFPTAGSYTHAGIFSDQYDTRTEAVKAEIDYLISYAEDNSSERGQKGAMEALRKERLNLCCPRLF